MSPTLGLILTIEAVCAVAALVGLEVSLILYILVEARQKWRMQTRKLKTVRGHYTYQKSPGPIRFQSPNYQILPDQPVGKVNPADIWQHRQDRDQLV